MRQITITMDNKIELEELGKSLYQLHLKRKNHRICKVLRILMLRKDFIPFLKSLEDKSLKQEISELSGFKIKLWRVNFTIARQLVKNYLDKISKCKYIKEQDKEWKFNFNSIAQNTILHTYLDEYANLRNRNKWFNPKIFVDDSINYPNIIHNIYDREIFWKIFNDAFYKNNDILKKHGTPYKIVSSGPKYDNLPNKEKIIPTDPKVCQLTFDDATEKQELIDYINKNWTSIESSLKALRPSRKEKRLNSSGNFIRDIDIYNKYQFFKAEGYKNPDVKTYSWLNSSSEYKKYKEPNTIRKIVSLLKTEIEEINLEK